MRIASDRQRLDVVTEGSSVAGMTIDGILVTDLQSEYEAAQAAGGR